MDQSELLALAAKGENAWNEWIDKNPTEEVDFSGVLFEDGVDFTGFRFPPETTFDKATFRRAAYFNEAVFSGFARFNGATFSDFVGFQKATVSRDARFIDTVFLNRAHFNGATFSSFAYFNNAKFTGTADFEDATFMRLAEFRRATFSGTAVFRKATFTNVAEFREAKFTGTADFSLTTFKATSGNAASSKGTFTGGARFSAASIAKRLDFSTATFAALPWLRVLDGEKYIILPRKPIQFEPLTKRHRCRSLLVGQWTTSGHVLEELRAIRNVAHASNANDLERDLFILERQAEIGIGLQQWNDNEKVIQKRKILQHNPTLANRFQLGYQKLLATLVPARNAALILLYRWSAYYGRSILLPTVWIAILGLLFNHLYKAQYASWSMQCFNIHTEKLIADFTRGSLIPFASTTRPSYQSAIDQLFSLNGQIDIPVEIQRLALTHGVLNLILIFLIGLAVRNYFRVN